LVYIIEQNTQHMKYLEIKPKYSLSSELFSLEEKFKTFYSKYVSMKGGSVDMESSRGSLSLNGDRLIGIKYMEDFGPYIHFTFRKDSDPSETFDVPYEELSLNFLAMLENEIRKNESNS
jgi:hypothetical protein